MNKLNQELHIDYKYFKKVILILVIFSYIIGQKIVYIDNNTVNAFEFIIIMLSNQHYLIYCMALIFLFIIIGNLKYQNNIIVLSRFKTYKLYFLERILNNLVICIQIVLLQVIMALVIVLPKLKIVNSFNENTNDEILKVFSTNFSTPILAILVICSYMILGLFLFSTLLELINNTYSKGICIILIVIIYFFMTLRINSGNLDILNYFCIDNYFILSNSIYNNMSLNVILIEIAAFILIFMKVQFKN